MEAFNAGTALADGMEVDCNPAAVSNVSDVISVGDLFGVERNGTYYLVQVDEVNPVSGSNGDNYVVSIKY